MTDIHSNVHRDKVVTLSCKFNFDFSFPITITITTYGDLKTLLPLPTYVILKGFLN